MSLSSVCITHPIAHRALHDLQEERPENSRAAVHAAVKRGYGIEIDLQLSSDGVPMVFHDSDLLRLTGQEGRVRDHTAEELGRLLLLGGPETIPTLDEVLQLVKGRVPLLVEFKDQDGQMGSQLGGLEEAAAGILRVYEGPLAVMSFNPHSMAAMAELAPEVPRGLTTDTFAPADWPELTADVCERLRNIADYDRVGACFISHKASDLSRSRVLELKAQGAALLCWTITSPEAERAARVIADNVTFEHYLA
jgi:glycerophosphoryl diester phosphodiesterase